MKCKQQQNMNDTCQYYQENHSSSLHWKQTSNYSNNQNRLNLINTIDFQHDIQENSAANYLKEISQHHWLQHVEHQNPQNQNKKYFSMARNSNEFRNFNEYRKNNKNYLALNKTCTLRQRPTTMQKNAFFQYSQKQKDKQSRYKQRQAQTSIYFYQSLNLKSNNENVIEKQMFLDEINKTHYKNPSFHGFVNMKQALRSKSVYYQKLKYQLFKTFQIDGRPLFSQNESQSKQTKKDSYFKQSNQYFQQSLTKNKTSLNSTERRSVYSSKKKISLEEQAIFKQTPFGSLNTIAVVHSQLNRSKQLKLVQEDQYLNSLSKNKKKVYNHRNVINQRKQQKSTHINLNKPNDRIYKYNTIDKNKWDKNSMKGKLWLGRPPVKIVQSHEIEQVKVQ